jgi:hypothetical protein
METDAIDDGLKNFLKILKYKIEEYNIIYIRITDKQEKFFDRYGWDEYNVDSYNFHIKEGSIYKGNINQKLRKLKLEKLLKNEI